MPRRPIFAVLSLMLLLSGCLAEGPDGDATGPTAPRAVHFVAHPTEIACASLCEPVVVSDGDTVFVKGDTYGRGNVSTLGAFAPPPRPVHLGPNTFQSDRHLDVDAKGRLWFSALVAHSAQGAVFSLLGVQVARSDDGGDTWVVDRFLSLASPTPHDASGADRQWLAFAPDGTAWLTFQRNSPSYVLGMPTVDQGNVWISSSRDDGDTWTDFAPLDDEEGTGHATGRMVFDGETPLVPVQKWSGAAGLYVLSPGAPPVRVTDAGSFFPAFTPYRDGFLVATMDDAQTLQVFTWDRTSTTPLWNGTPEVMVSSPWVGVRGDSYDVVWLERTAGTEDRFDVLWSRDGAAPRVVAAGLRGDWGVRANTDFAHFTYHNDRVLIVAGDNEDASLALYWETTG